MKPLWRKWTGDNLTGWKRWLAQILLLLVLLGIGGLLVAAAGVVPIKASSGHWSITEWLLQFSKRRSVDTYTKTIEAPPLDDPVLITRGAGSYQVGCFACHGNPDHQFPRVARAMLPPPPYLPEQIAEWEDAELFHIVKHGIKFTGMPAWPSQQRDDEVWAMVAFLRKFPELNAEEYRRLAGGSSDPGHLSALNTAVAPAGDLERLKQFCGGCHGSAGEGRWEGAFPRLAGQSREYLAGSLTAYSTGDRHSGIMQTAASGLKAEDIQSLASYFSGLQPLTLQESAAEEELSLVETGERIAREGLPDDHIPACSQCHGPGEARNPHYPQLAGLSFGYLKLQLGLFQRGQRGGTKFKHLMDPVARHIRADQIDAVSAYYASLPAPGQQTAE